MARRRKEKEKVDPLERARLKKLRAAQRREERKKRKTTGDREDDEPRRSSRRSTEDHQPLVKDDFLWLKKDLAKAFALKVLNEHRDRPYWLRIPHAQGDGNPPVTRYYPCIGIRTATHVYYGFLFREHRELAINDLPNARRVLTSEAEVLAPYLR